MTRPRNRRLWPFGAAAGALALGLILVGCGASDAGDPTASPVPSSAPSANPGETPGPEETPDETEPDVVIVFAELEPDRSAVSVSSYVSGLIEEGGQCAAILTLDGVDYTAESEGLADKGTTSCGVLSIPSTDIPRGEGELHVRYTAQDGRVLESERQGVILP